MGVRSEQVLKSISLRLMNTFSVKGAELEGEVRRRIECNLTWPVKLFPNKIISMKENVIFSFFGRGNGRTNKLTGYASIIAHQHH